MSAAENKTPVDSSSVYLIIADVWHKDVEEPVEVHMLLTLEEDADLVQTALSILADEGYDEAELLEIGTLDSQPDEEPHKSAWETAMRGEIALIEFDGDEDDEEDED